MTPVASPNSNASHQLTEQTAADPKRLRICHVSMSLKTGGLERLLVEFARCHQQQKFELFFVALEDLGPPAEELRNAGHKVISVELNKHGKWEAVKSLKKFLIENQIDLLHTHNTYPHFYGSLAARWAGIKTIINTQHGRGCGSGVKDHWQFRIANRLSKRVVGVSEDAAALCRDQDRLSSSKIICLWNGIDVDRFQYSGPRPEPVAIAVARLSAEKDFATLFRAIAIVVKTHPEFRLKLVGDGAERTPLEQLANELGISQHIEFLGERKDVPDLLRTAGFYVSSSKTEGISLTLLEAMAVGLPVLTTRVGGNPEVVIEGITGSLVPSQDAEALAAGICQMLAQQSEWPEMGMAARARIEQQFNVRRMVSDYEALYLECSQQK